MKISKLLAASAVIFGLSTSYVAAQEGDKPERPRRGQNAERGDRPERPGRRGPGGEGAGPGQMLKRLPIIMALDADSDGVISEKEIEGAVAALKKLDKNGDGKITLEEMVPRGMGGPGPRGPGGPGGRDQAAAGARFEQMFQNRDADGNGKLTGDEIPEMLQGRMERVDANGDGAIEKEELMKVVARMGRGDRSPGRGLGREQGKDGSGVKPKRPESK